MRNRDAVLGVLAPPQLQRFCRIAGVTPDELTPNFTGWMKLALLSRDRAFLFPRDARRARWFRRELRVYELLGHRAEVPAPRLLEVIDDRRVYPHPVGVVTRVGGVPAKDVLFRLEPDRVGRVFDRLIDAVVAWHSISSEDVPAPLGQVPYADAAGSARTWTQRVLDPRTTDRALRRAVRRVEQRAGEAGMDAKRLVHVRAWQRAIDELLAIPSCLVHGDIHEDQVWVDPRTLKVTGVLDWEIAGVGHPVFDLDFYEWDVRFWRRFEPRFPAIRRAMWARYLRARGLDGTPETLHLFFTLARLAADTLHPPGDARRALRALRDATALAV